VSLGFHSHERVRQSELMDDPTLALDQYHSALRGLAKINWFSRTPRLLWGPMAALARRLNSNRLRVLDVAAGGCDVPLTLWRHGQSVGLNLEFHCVDINDRAIAFARKRAEACSAPFTFGCLDAMEGVLPSGFDVAICSLFFQHLSDEQSITVLQAMARAARYLVLVNDVRRGWGSLMLARMGRVLTGSKVVGIDAVRAARAAFTLEEMRDMSDAAGLKSARVRRTWPCRFLLEWQR
jgi:SAM-dependent methyltransferase